MLSKLFTVPKGKKITEKAMIRVLVCSCCSILLTLSCLVGTTWAWYTATVETQPFSVTVAEHALHLHNGTDYAPFTGSLTLAAGESRQIKAKFHTDATEDAFAGNAGRYITITAKNAADETVYSGYVVVEKNADGQWLADFTLTTEAECTVWLATSWFVPANAKPFVPANPLARTAETTEPTGATGATTEPTGATGATTEPTGATGATTEPTGATGATTEPTGATGATTEPTGATNEVSGS